MGILDKITHPKPYHPAQQEPEPSDPPVQAGGDEHRAPERLTEGSHDQTAPTAGGSVGTTAGGTPSAGGVEGENEAGEEELVAGKVMAESANNFPGTNPHPAHSALGGQGLSMSGRE